MDPDDDLAQASNPAELRWSQDKLAALRPDVCGLWGYLRRLVSLTRLTYDPRPYIEESLFNGDARAAVVLQTKPLLIAAYTDELDCVAVLRFPDQLAIRHHLAVGQRLVTVNTYGNGGPPVDDLIPSPNDTGNWTNFHPTIADLASDDAARIEYLKQRIPDDEWQQAWTLGKEYLLVRPGVCRDGRPMYAALTAKDGRALERENQAEMRRSVILTGAAISTLLMLLLCGGFGLGAVRGVKRHLAQAQFAAKPAPDVAPAPPPAAVQPDQAAAHEAAPILLPPLAIPHPIPQSPPPVPTQETPNSTPPSNPSEAPQPDSTTPPPTATTNVPQSNAKAWPKTRSTGPAVPTGPSKPPKRGDKLYLQWGSTWEEVEVLDVPSGGLVRIRWSRWGPSWDQLVPLVLLADQPPPDSASVMSAGPFGSNAPGLAIDDTTPLRPGQKVYAYSMGQWQQGRIVSFRTGTFVVVQIPSTTGSYRDGQQRTVTRRLLRLVEDDENEKPKQAAASKKSGPLRTWTDASGQFKTEARFLELAQGTVVLEKADGSLVSLPLDKLSPEDQRYANAQDRKN